MTGTRTRAAALREIHSLNVAQDAAWEAMKDTQRVCECCGNSYYPKDTPEWAAWELAFEAKSTAVGVAVEDGVIPERTAILQCDIAPAALTVYRMRYRHAKMAVGNVRSE